MAVDAPPIDWTQEKADILAQVIDRSRATNSEGADWKGLADHLQVPLSYLLYRIQARYEEELRDLKDVRSALGSATPTNARPFPSSDRTSLIARASSRLSTTRLSSSGRLSSPVGVRTRLTSLGHRQSSSSTTTIQATKYSAAPFRPQPSISITSDDNEDADSENEDSDSEEAEKIAEEQQSLDKRLQALQKMMTSEALGLVSSPRSTFKKPSDSIYERGRIDGAPPRVALSSRSTSTTSASQSMSSSASSPPGSIPSIPSPTSDSPMGRHLSTSKSSSPPALSPRSARGQSHLRLDNVLRQGSEQGSNQGSETSSFSDISDASLSASALESAMSNIRIGNSRFLPLTRTRVTGRGGVYQ